MGNLFSGIKKFFINKTTVTLFGVVLGVVVLVGFYMYRVNNAVNPEEVIVATRDITATEEITADDVKKVKISSSFLTNSDIITNANLIVGKYVATGTSIPKGGMFYSSQLVEKEELPNSIFDEIPDKYTIYQLKVNNTSTYANSIFPGDKIDLWMKANQDGKIVIGQFITSIEVLAVRDAQGENVFDVTSGKTPAWLLFAVPTSTYRYLKVSEYISGMEITPVPRNKQYTIEDGETEITNQDLLNLIKNQIKDMGVVYE